MNDLDFKLYLENSKTATVWHCSPNSNLYILKATGMHSGTQAVKQNKAGIYVAPKFRDSLMWFASYVRSKKDHLHKHINQHYDQGTFYKIEVPQFVLKKSWFNNSWEPEYFIQEEDIHNLKIIKKETYNAREVNKMLFRIDNKEKAERQNRRENKANKQLKSNYAFKVYQELKEYLYSFIMKVRLNEDQLNVLESILKKINSYCYNYDDGWYLKAIATIDDKKMKEVDQLKNNFYEKIGQFKNINQTSNDNPLQ